MTEFIDIRCIGVLEGLNGLRKDHPKQRTTDCVTRQTEYREEQGTIPA